MGQSGLQLILLVISFVFSVCSASYTVMQLGFQCLELLYDRNS